MKNMSWANQIMVMVTIQIQFWSRQNIFQNDKKIKSIQS